MIWAVQEIGHVHTDTLGNVRVFAVLGCWAAVVAS